MEFDASPFLPSSSSRSLPGAEYDVYLSFSGPDTVKTFTDHLYFALVDAGVRPFRDDDELRIGEKIGPEVLKAISESQILIPILSKNYASSKWCLRELAQMVEHRRTTGQLILPIFYSVEPSDVRHQSGTYEEAFREHERCFDERTIVKWKEALREVGELKGCEVNKEADGHEAYLIQRIVQAVLLELKRNYMFLTDRLIGIDHHENEMMTLLNVSSNDVQIVSICGIGGIGKTTIAKVIYNKLIQNFDCCCFLENIRESAQQHNGLVSLQKQLLADTLNWHPDIADVDSGIYMIKHRFQRKKVLLILDDVTERSQLDCLVGNPIWFGPGSRIIVTTRGKHVLGALEVNGIYEPPFMDSEQALQLFSMHAFRSKFPPEAYDSISREIVSIAGGLPLALEVIGSSLSGKGMRIWEAALEKLKKVPDNIVFRSLMISYEALSDEQKQIFLDIACLFFGMDKTYAFYMWDDCGYDTETEINALCLMSLVKIGDDNVLWMQNQLRDLGTEIVRKENFFNPGKRSRLWDHEEALDILEAWTGTEMVEALSLDFELGSQSYFTNDQFQKLIKLRYLQMHGAELVGDFKHLLPNLRWLNWHGCPSIFKPANFHLKKLVILDLSYSEVTEDWGGWSQIKMAKNLKVLKLAYCSMRRTPDLSTHALLEILILRGCACLIEIGRSIGNLKKLKVLDISETHVRKLPDEVWMLEKLEINATDCFYLKRDIPSCIGGQSSKRFLSSVASKPLCFIFILFFSIVGARLHRASTAAR